MSSTDDNENSEIQAQMEKCRYDFHQILNDFKLEEYIEFKRLYPEFDIAHGPFKNMEELFDVSDELIEFGLDPLMLASVLDGDENVIDAFCVELLSKLNDRRKLEKEDISHIQSRRQAIPDSLLHFLIILIIESCQFHQVNLTHSLAILIIEMFGGANIERRRRVKLKLRKKEIAETIASLPEISNRELQKATGIDFTTISRWRKEKEFTAHEKMCRKIYDDTDFQSSNTIIATDLNEVIDFINSIPSSCNLDYITVSWRFRKYTE